LLEHKINKNEKGEKYLKSLHIKNEDCKINVNKNVKLIKFSFLHIFNLKKYENINDLIELHL